MHLEIVVQGKCVVSHKPGVLIGWSSMQNLHCLCCVTGFEAARDPGGPLLWPLGRAVHTPSQNPG